MTNRSNLLTLLTLYIVTTCLTTSLSRSNNRLGYVYRLNATQRAVGSVVPWPRQIKFLNGPDYLAINPAKFEFKLVSNGVGECDIIKRALSRYANSLLFDDVKPEEKDDPVDPGRRQLGSLDGLNISERGEQSFKCESIPSEDMDELYDLAVEIGPNNETVASLTSSTCWGILRGLETFSQLVFNIGQDHYAIQTVQIEDWPRFKFRGYMLDTARHYITIPTILNLLDAMAFNKLNIFHWHMVDDQSFPYESSTYPKISERSSFRPTMVYTQGDVLFVIRYAADRGIRVIPELDTPGHTYALRHIPNLLTKCYDRSSQKPNGQLGPIDPTKVGSYKAVGKLVRELSTVFPDNYFHAGGDEVDFECWRSNPEVSEWMEKRNITGKYHELSNYYIKRIYDILSHYNRTMLVWQEVFDDGANLPKDTIIHVWKYENDRPAYMVEMKSVVRSGYRALLSSCWYLNYIDYGQDWIKFYQCDPASEPIKEDEEKLILGGEVCMWSEFVDDTNVISRTWPRASAAAERLWSSKTETNVEKFLNRLEQLRCRMLFRGLKAEPVNGPGYC